ncbi:MAG: NusG domain II-containing protein [Treponema sp.]|nr:NusG domain II-containing protein [Treponema sp.]
MFKIVKPLDWGIIFTALVLVITSFYFAYSGSNSPAMVNIKSGNDEWLFPIDAEETLAFSGPLGETVINISDGKARFISSPCMNQTCVASGAVQIPGQWAACLPNRIMLFIGEGDIKIESNVDAVSR